ncbi:endonuclease domain-containing protein [Geodermatophilus siccatus]|uniref:endonuclease domain-containing protein n=1 Tax=Geodermatophilus siccatus TaxID=1137991 RepID=UPI000B81337A
MRSSRAASGVASRCRPCHNAANGEYYVQREHRLTMSQVADLTAARGGRCAICGDPAPHLDHDHETGATRPMLCRRCNRAWASSATTRRSCTRPPSTSTRISSGSCSRDPRRRSSSGRPPGARPRSRR